MSQTLPEPGVTVVKDDFVPNRKQLAFWDACHDPGAEEILFDGAIRSGKTQAAAKLIVAWAWKYGGPNWKFVVMRKTYRELADSVQAAFYRGDGKMPPCCPPGLIEKFLAKDETLILKNGAQILFRSAENASDTEDKIRNVTIAGFFIDQVEELTGSAYFQLYETLTSRMSDPRGPGKALLVANPGPEDHWVHNRFVDELTKEGQTRRVTVTLMDNEHNLTPNYVARMKRRKETNPMFYRRFILGEWGAFGGKRFPGWDPALHVCEPFEIPQGWEVIQGIDYGWANPTASVWIAIDYDGRWWVVGEHFEKEKPVSFHAAAMKQLEADLNISPSSIWMDPSTWAKRTEYESPGMEFADYGIFAARAQNDRLGGWNRIDEMMSERMKDGFPRLRFFNTCPNVIRELPSAKIKDGTDDIEKENDHAIDALRYAIMSRMPSPIREEEEDKPYLDRVIEDRIDKAEGRQEQPLRML
jgi:PBSX family phage terminase large subunit